MHRRKKAKTNSPEISLSNVDNKDRNTIYIDLPKENVQQYAEKVIKKNKPLFDKLAIS
jgi:hypothetical protein